MADEETPETSKVTSDSEAQGSAGDESGAQTRDQESDAAPPAAEPAEIVHPKERKRRARAAKAARGPARPSMTPEERLQERAAERRRKREVRRVARVRARQKARERAGETRETPAREQAPGKQQTRQGVVVTNRATKTITVRIDTTRRHRRYEKIVRTSRTLHAHDERGEAGIGDTVIVRESRPLSRTKRWRLVEIVEKAE